VRDNAWSYDQLAVTDEKEYQEDPIRDTYYDRFVKNTEYPAKLMSLLADPEKVPKRAIMDMGAIYTAKTFQGENQYNPRLDSPNGVIAGLEDEPTWWQVRFPGLNSIYEVSMLTLKKRADCCKEKVITRVQLEYSPDQGSTWIKYQNG